MPRKRFTPSSEHYYHVRARTTNREWFRLPMPFVWEVFSDYLWFANKAFDLQILNFVLMSNHFHLICLTPNADLDRIMNHSLREISRVLSREAGRINQTFGGPYGRTLITSEHYLLHAYKYVTRNPVEAGISRLVQDYPFSTLSGLLGRQRISIPLVEDKILFDSLEDSLNWLNQEYPNEAVKDDIRKALRRSEFKFPRAGLKNASIGS